MIGIIKEAIFWLHVRIFGDEPGDITKKFMKSLSYVGIGFMLSAVLGTLIQVYIGRILGPADYGLFSLIRSISLFLIIPLTMVSFALVKYTAETEDALKRKRIISISVSITALMMLISVPIFYLFGPYIAGYIPISRNHFNLVILMAIGTALADLARRLLQGLHKMKKIGLMEFVSTMSKVILVLLFFIVLGKRTVESAVFAFFLGFSITILFILPELKKYFGNYFDKELSTTILRYSTYALLGNVSYVVIANVDRILIGKFLDMTSLGIYQVYNLSTLGVIVYITVILGTVLFPEASRRDKHVVWKKLKRGMKVAPLIYIFTMLSCLVFLVMYGKDYPMNPYYILIFPILPTVYFVYNIYEWYSLSLGVDGMKNAFYCRFGVAVLTIAGDILLIPRIGIVGAAISMIVAFTIAIPFLMRRIRLLIG